MKCALLFLSVLALLSADAFQRPQTTRRYLQGPLSERIAVFLREGSVTLGEVVHDDDWKAMPYGAQSAHGLYLLHGETDVPYEFSKAELRCEPDGVPILAQSWRQGSLEVDFTACSPIARRSTVFGRVTFANRGDAQLHERVGFLLRTAHERDLIGGAPDIYRSYDHWVAFHRWFEISPNWDSCGGNLFRDGDRFAAFEGCGSPSFNRRVGIVRYELRLAPGESRTVEFALGKGATVRPGYSAAEAETREGWRKALMRAGERTDFVRHQLVQILQCFARPTEGDFVLPRQGGLQRWVWPGETVHVTEALTRYGYADYARMAIDFMMRFASGDGRIGPFGNDWGGNTAYVVEAFARHCLDTGDAAYWTRHAAAAERAFRWMKAMRASTVEDEGVTAGLFPPSKSTDMPQDFQHWGMTDLVNEKALGVFAEAAAKFGAPFAAEIAAERKDYRGAISCALDRWRAESNGKDTFFIPLAPDGRNEAELRNANFFYLHPGAFAEGGFLDEGEMLRLRKWLIDAGIAHGNGLYLNIPSADPTLGRGVWYTTWSEYQWFVGWMRVGRKDLAHEALEALLAYSVTSEFYVGERIHEDNPWYFPWSPNASGSARILKMLDDER